LGIFFGRAKAFSYALQVLGEAKVPCIDIGMRFAWFNIHARHAWMKYNYNSGERRSAVNKKGV
jgi:hypothetical protein